MTSGQLGGTGRQVVENRREDDTTTCRNAYEKEDRIDEWMRCIPESAILSQSRSLSRIFTALSRALSKDFVGSDTVLNVHVLSAPAKVAASLQPQVEYP